MWFSVLIKKNSLGYTHESLLAAIHTCAIALAFLRLIDYFTSLILFNYGSLGVFAAPFSMYALPVLWVAFASMLIESLPFKDVDNITLTIVSALIGHFVF